MIILSCGHEVADFDHAFTVMVKSTSREGEKAIAHMIVCGACEDQYRQHGELFDTEQQADDWLQHERW